MEISAGLEGSDWPQRILVVDDDLAILNLVRLNLEQEGFTVQAASSAQAALDIINRSGLPHLAIVDIHMPGMDGFEFCRRVQRFSDLPVILLTAVDREEVVIQGIEHYAEDYVIKPFSPRELAARVRRVLRRMGSFAYTTGPSIPVDDRLAVNFPQQEAKVDEQVVPLTPTETKLLYILMRNPHHTVTSDFLLRRMWPLEEVFEDTLRVHVHRLRQKIEPNPSRPRYLVTVRGLGYSWLPTVP